MGCITSMVTVDARELPPHAGAAALSLPATHPNGRSHAGQPVPTYSTVLLSLWPHVVTVSSPPSGVAEPRSSAYSSREPPKNARNPVAHVPDVYMAGMPATAVDSRGAVPLVPVSRRTSGNPRHTGGVGVGVAVQVLDALPVRARLGAPLGVPVRLALGVPVPKALEEPVPVALDEPVPVALDEPVPVALEELVPVAMDVPVCVTLDDTVPIWLAEPVPVEPLEPVLVMLGDGAPNGLRRLATLRPRYVSRSTTLVGVSPTGLPPPPPAASHSSADSRSPLA